MANEFVWPTPVVYGDTEDLPIARVRCCHELPGHRLLQYVDEDGEVCPLTSTHINDKLHELTGETFTAKTFRTWGDTVDAFGRLAGQPLPTSESEQVRTLNQQLRETAKVLANTLAVCRKYYVHPEVLEAYHDGTLSTRQPDARARRGLSGVETAALRFLTQA